MTPSGKPLSSVSPSLHQKLNTYALAASAAGVGVLALTQPAGARIVYTPTHHVIGKNGVYKLDLNHDKIADLTLMSTYGCNTDYCYDILSAIPAGSNGVEGAKGFLSIPYASALKFGAQIGPKANFSGRLMASSNMGTIGRWVNVTNDYLGLKFTIKGKTHYGWARLSVHVLGGGSIRATLTGYAYETIPNKSIIAGKTKNDANETSIVGHATPTAVAPASAHPNSLGLLAIGSSARSAWRRESR